MTNEAFVTQQSTWGNLARRVVLLEKQIREVQLLITEIDTIHCQSCGRKTKSMESLLLTRDGRQLCTQCYKREEEQAEPKMTRDHIMAMGLEDLNLRVALDVCHFYRMHSVWEKENRTVISDIRHWRPDENWQHFGLVHDAMQEKGFALELIPTRTGYTIRWLHWDEAVPEMAWWRVIPENIKNALCRAALCRAALCAVHGV